MWRERQGAVAGLVEAGPGSTTPATGHGLEARPQMGTHGALAWEADAATDYNLAFDARL